MKEPANDCNLTDPIFNISSLNSKMTRYDPNTVPIMQHWSKWPFHTEEWKKINPAPPSLFFFLFCFTIPCIHKFHWLQLQPAHVCIQYIPSKMLLVKSTDPSTENNLFMPNTSNSFVHKHVVFLFVFVCFFCLPPVSPSPVASPRQLQDTPAMLNPRSRDRWRKRGQTSLPISRSAGLGAIIMANSSPAWPREQEKKRDGKSEIGTMPKHISLQDLSWFGVRLDTLHFLFDC